jgi:hypothetical protein
VHEHASADPCGGVLRSVLVLAAVTQPQALGHSFQRLRDAADVPGVVAAVAGQQLLGSVLLPAVAAPPVNAVPGLVVAPAATVASVAIALLALLVVVFCMCVVGCSERNHATSSSSAAVRSPHASP